MTGRWLVLVDVAPATVRSRIERSLRDLGFVEVLPCAWESRWLVVEQKRLRAAIRGARRGGVGRVLIVRLRGPTSLL